MANEFLTGVRAKRFLRHSLFRDYQHHFLAHHGARLTGTVVEIGAEAQYGHQQHFSNASSYLATNISGLCDACVDATSMPFADGAVDSLACLSVVEHIYDIQAAFAEFRRVLRPGGLLVLTVPFAFPIHDRQDFWRPTDQSLDLLLRDGFEPIEITHLGGKISTIVSGLQRPLGKYSKRYLPLKVFGLGFAAAVGRFDQPDGSPLGWGVVAQRRS